MDWRIITILVSGTLLSIQAFGSSWTIPSAPCTIYIDSMKNNGEQVKLQFTTRLRNRAECLTLAQLHRPNYDSRAFLGKKVRYGWNQRVKKHAKAKHKPYVAKAKKFIRGYTRTLPKKTGVYLATFRQRRR